MANVAKEKSVNAQINERVINIRKKGKELRAYCVETLAMIINHAVGAGNGDISKLGDFRNAVTETLGNSMGAAVNLWIAKFTPWIIEKKNPQLGENAFYVDTSVPVEKRKVKPAKEVKTNLTSTSNLGEFKDVIFNVIEGEITASIEDATKFPFYWLEPEAKTTPAFDFVKAFEQLVARAKRELAKKDNHERDDNLISHKQIEMLEALKEDIINAAPKQEDLKASEDNEPAQLVHVDDNATTARQTTTDHRRDNGGNRSQRKAAANSDRKAA